MMETNFVQTPGYGEDEYCERARKIIKEKCGTPDAYVQFLVGGTQTNMTVIASILRPYQGVLSAVTGHINAHETGAIEATGHKVLALPSENGKITAAQVQEAYDAEVEVVRAVKGDNNFVINNMEDDLTWLDRLIQILLNPILRSIFMMMIIGGIFVEIRTPGIGLPLLTAVAGALLYFAPAYLGHLVSYWEILLFVAGLVLIGVEIFVLPGFGVCGITGIVAVVVSLAFAMVDNADLFHWDGSLNLEPVIMPLGIVILSASVAVFGSVWLVKKLYPDALQKTV